MSIIGIDIGSAGCVITTIEKGGLKMVRNDVSELITPTLIGYTDEERLFGGAAEVRSNAANTCRGMKNIIGRTMEDPVVQLEKEFVLGKLDVAEDGSVGFRVNYKGESRVFSAAAVTGTLLAGLKRLAEKSINSHVRDVVVGVPGSYGDAQRRAIIQACKIAGLNCLRVMNEHTAVALDYGIYRRADFDETKPTNVVFVCGGQSLTIVSVVAFTASGLKVLSEEVEYEATGRNFDLAIIKKFTVPFDAKYGTNLLANGKARLKLEDSANKCKKVLSANLEAPFNAECVFEEYDIAGMVTRDDFVAACAPFASRITNAVKRAVETSGVAVADLHSVELVGGCTRIGWVQEAVQAAVGSTTISRTLHMDECVARGCALQAAMLSPAYKVKDFAVVDRLTAEVIIRWAKEDGTPKEASLFPAGSALNSSKVVTFDRASNINLTVVLKKKTETGASVEENLGTYRIELPANIPAEKPLKVKVGIDLDIHGRIEVLSATSIEENVIVEKVREKKALPKPAPTPEAAAEGAEAPAAEVEGVDFEYVEKEVSKTLTERKSLKIVPPTRPGLLTDEQVKAAMITEENLYQADLAHTQVKELLNSLESLVYSSRDLVSDYGTEEEKGQLNTLIEATENWLYDFGYIEMKKNDIEAKYNGLINATAALTARKYEATKEEEMPVTATEAETEAAPAATEDEDLD